jgi:5-methyltetrahydropteroyltriglutamate--homocysteine methyltransferase
MKGSNMMDLPEIGAAITDMKVCVGAIDHHTLHVEAPTEVADLIRQALKVIPAERLVVSSKSLVQGTNLVKKELGLPVTESLGADPKSSLIRTT